MDLLTGAASKNQSKALQMQQDESQAAQRRSLAQLAAEQGELDQQAAGTGRRRRGRGLLTFATGTPGIAALGG